MIENLNDSPKESILYEVLEYFVKKQEPEITVIIDLTFQDVHFGKNANQ